MIDQTDVKEIAARLVAAGHWVSLDFRISEETAGELIGVGKRTMRRWRDEGRGPAFVMVTRKKITYRIADILAFIESRSHDPQKYLAA